MITFGILRADLQAFAFSRFETLNDALLSIGLKPGEVDHGTVAPGVSIVVYQFGLYLPPEKTYYASINRQLIADRAVLYAYDKYGETASLTTLSLPKILYHGMGQENVEKAIQAGIVNRPVVKAGPNLIWQWPEQVDPEETIEKALDQLR